MNGWRSSSANYPVKALALIAYASLSASLFALFSTGVHGVENLRQPGLHKRVIEAEQIRYTVFVPDGLEPERQAPLVLALHYGGQVTPFYGAALLVNLIEPAFGDSGAILVAPDNDGSGWDNPNSESKIMVLLEHFREHYQIDPTRIALTGYSLGGIGTWYLAARNQRTFAAAIPLAAPPSAGVEDVEWQIPLFVVHARADELFDLASTQAAVERLRARNVDIDLKVVEHATHYDVSAFVPPLTALRSWLAQALRLEP